MIPDHCFDHVPDRAQLLKDLKRASELAALTGCLHDAAEFADRCAGLCRQNAMLEDDGRWNGYADEWDSQAQQYRSQLQ